MGRYETLNDDSKDVVNCLLPGIAANFDVTEVVDVIPSDIRMREWDCDRKEHVKDKPEDDPRNWGLQFLKDLITISRIKKGKLDEFQADLRKHVQAHSPSHPWAKLSDIKEIKENYAGPREKKESGVQEKGGRFVSEYSSTDDSYFEEFVEPTPMYPKKRGRPSNSSRHKEVYDSQMQRSKSHKYGSTAAKRLRRSSDNWERRDKSRHHGGFRRSDYPGDEYFNENDGDLSIRRFPAPAPISPGRLSASEINENFEDMSLDELELQLQVAEAELKTARLRLMVNEARRSRIGGYNGFSRDDGRRQTE